MTQGQVSRRTVVVNMLADAGTWVSRAELDAVSTCRPAVDDTLADLVMEGLAEYRKGAGYRLAATDAQREALQLLRRGRKQRAVVVKHDSAGGRVGVAEIREPIGLVLYALELPPVPQGAAGHAVLKAQTDAVIKFLDAKGGATDARPGV